MSKRKNPVTEFDFSEDEMVIDTKESADPTEFPLWYQQFMKLDEKKRKEITKTALERIKQSKPDAYYFITRFKCKLVGVTPQIAYALDSSKEGDTEVTWIHGYSMPTLLYWCPAGRFGFFVNANLDYDETVLNSVKGNKKQGIKGFTA